MSDIITIYHGSEQIIQHPEFGAGRKHNDFGPGFYCTEDKELAKEWAVSPLRDGYCSRYTLDTRFMKILKLDSADYTILNWIAILTGHRLFTLDTPIARRARSYLIENFSINVNAFDLILGYRADDSYFDYADAFINNSITVGQLARAMYLGRLGEQVVLKSRFAFSAIHFEGCEKADSGRYFKQRVERNEEANRRYRQILEEDEDDGLFIRDIIRERIGNKDPRIPACLPQ